MIRVISNYFRLGATFIVGIYLMRRLLGADVSVYSAFLLATIGLAVGVMIREAARMSLVAFMAPSKSSTTGQISALAIRQSNFLILILVVFYAALVGFTLLITPFLNIDSAYRDQFNTFIALRSVGFSIFIFSIPLLNILAYEKRMVPYNFWLIFERLADLACVEVALRTFTESGKFSLIYGGFAYVFICIVGYIVFWLFTRATVAAEHSLKLSKPSKVLTRSWGKQIWGAGVLVVAMGIYFRLTLLLSNSFFGESFGVIVGIGIQLAGYLRQSVVALITGLDSLFSRLDNSGKAIGLDINGVSVYAAGTVCALFFVFALIAGYFEEIASFLLTQGNSDLLTGVVSFGMLMTLGVFIRSTSDVWMQALVGIGKVYDFSIKLLGVSLGYLFSILLIHMLDFSDNNALTMLGSSFILCMGISHWYFVPSILKRQLQRVSYFKVIKPVLVTTGCLLLCLQLLLWMPPHIKILDLFSFSLIALLFVYPIYKRHTWLL